MKGNPDLTNAREARWATPTPFKEPRRASKQLSGLLHTYITSGGKQYFGWSATGPVKGQLLLFLFVWSGLEIVPSDDRGCGRSPGLQSFEDEPGRSVGRAWLFMH